MEKILKRELDKLAVTVGELLPESQQLIKELDRKSTG